MQLQLNDFWRVRTDSLNWILENYAKRRKKKGDEEGAEVWTWSVQGYYGSLKALLQGMVSEDIRETGEADRLLAFEASWHKIIDELPEKLLAAAKEAQRAKPPKKLEETENGPDSTTA